LFWEPFWPQLAATIIGVLIGFPITIFATFLGAGLGVYGALLLNRHQEKQQRLKELREVREREGKILKLLQQELLMSFGQLARYHRKQDIKRLITLSVFLKTEIWGAFSNGGDLQWIKDPDLLRDIAEAYNFIRMMRELSNRYIELTRVDSTVLEAQAADQVIELLNRGVYESMFEIETALKVIAKARGVPFEKQEEDEEIND